MKRFVFFLVLFCSFNQLSQAQTLQPSYYKDAYAKGYLHKNKDTLYYQRLFFKAFPSDFNSFNNLYGWDEVNHVGRPLTAIGPHYFTNIFYSKAYSRNALLKKIISVCVNGELHEGAIGRFQLDCFQLALDHNAEFTRVLQTFSNKDIISVWKFYFDQPNVAYRKEAYGKIIAVTQRNTPGLLPAIKSAFKKAQSKWTAHR